MAYQNLSMPPFYSTKAQFERHLQADYKSVNRIPSTMEFSAERLKTQTLGGQAETIIARGNDTR